MYIVIKKKGGRERNEMTYSETRNLDATFTFRTERVPDQPAIDTIAMEQMVAIQVSQFVSVLKVRETDGAFLVAIVEILLLRLYLLCLQSLVGLGEVIGFFGNRGGNGCGN